MVFERDSCTVHLLLFEVFVRLLNPGGAPSSMFLKRLGILLVLLLKRKLNRHIQTPLRSWPRLDAFNPFDQVRELFDVDTCPECIVAPAKVALVCNGVLAANKPIARFAESSVKHTIQSPSLILVACDTVWLWSEGTSVSSLNAYNLLWCVSEEVVGLALHGSLVSDGSLEQHSYESRVHEEHPLKHIVVLLRAKLKAELAVLVIFVGQVEHDGARLSHAVVVVAFVNDTGNTAVLLLVCRPHK